MQYNHSQNQLKFTIEEQFNVGVKVQEDIFSLSYNLIKHIRACENGVQKFINILKDEENISSNVYQTTPQQPMLV